MTRGRPFYKSVCWLLILTLGGCYARGPLKLDQPISSLPFEVGDQAVIYKKNGEVVEIMVTYIGEEPYVIGNLVTSIQGNSANSSYSGSRSDRTIVGRSVQIMYADIDAVGGEGAKLVNNAGTVALAVLLVLLLLSVQQFGEAFEDALTTGN